MGSVGPAISYMCGGAHVRLALSLSTKLPPGISRRATRSASGRMSLPAQATPFDASGLSSISDRISQPLPTALSKTRRPGSSGMISANAAAYSSAYVR